MKMTRILYLKKYFYIFLSFLRFLYYTLLSYIILLFFVYIYYCKYLCTIYNDIYLNIFNNIVFHYLYLLQTYSTLLILYFCFSVYLIIAWSVLPKTFSNLCIYSSLFSKKFIYLHYIYCICIMIKKKKMLF
jgi:hypothetical protein